jgi:ATP-dependent Clp protease ATP-binding subunit ClpB
MTSNLASEEIREASPVLRALVAETENRHQQYLQVIGKFNRKIHPILKASLKRDEFLGRINQIIVFLPLDDSEVRGYTGYEKCKLRHCSIPSRSVLL